MPDTIMAQPAVPAFLKGQSTAPAYWSQGILWIILADSSQTNGESCWIEELIPQGPAAPRHFHAAADEIFYMLEGEATFFVGDEGTPIKAGVGSLVYIPRQTIHAFQIDSETARLLNGYTPGGFEQQIIALSGPAKERTLPPKHLAKPFDASEAAKFAEATARIVAQYPYAKTINLF